MLRAIKIDVAALDLICVSLVVANEKAKIQLQVRIAAATEFSHMVGDRFIVGLQAVGSLDHKPEASDK